MFSSKKTIDYLQLKTENTINNKRLEFFHKKNDD